MIRRRTRRLDSFVENENYHLSTPRYRLDVQHNEIQRGWIVEFFKGKESGRKIVGERCERRISLAYGYASRQGETRNEYSEVISL